MEKECKDPFSSQTPWNINLFLQYYSRLFACKFSRNPSKKIDRKKETKSFCQICPFEIYLVASGDCNVLVVLQINLEHKHEKSKDLYQSLPRQRLLPGHVLEKLSQLPN